MKYLEEIKTFCKSDPVKENVKQFAQALFALTSETVTTATQTVSDNISHTGTQTKNNPLDAVSSIAKEKECTIVQAISQVTEQLCSYKRSFLVSNMWTQIHPEDQIKLLFLFYNEMVVEHQSKLFALLGNSLNSLIYKASKENEKFAKDFDIEYLIPANKTVFYNSCNDRLKCYICLCIDRKKYKQQ